MTDNGHSGSFFRQRRALVAISLVLLAFQYTGAEVRQVQVFGNTIDFSRALPLEFSLWIGLVYLTLRYYQYAREPIRRLIGEEYRLRFNTLADPKAYNELKRRILASAPLAAGQSDPRLQWSIPLRRREPPFYTWLFDVAADCYDDVKKARVGLKTRTTETVQLQSRDLFWQKVRSGLWVAFNTHLVTEYLLPLVLACLPVLWLSIRLVSKLVGRTS